jgi:hypothetical protein
MKNITFSKQDSRFQEEKKKPRTKSKTKKTKKTKKETTPENILQDLEQNFSSFEEESKEAKELEAFMSDNFSIISDIRKKDHSVYTKNSRKNL